jgi:tRNA1Val (adenine37-N6)-methyltransferase
MPKNSVFHFKQFSVAQDKCAMKVCTDACIFGALAAPESKGNVLDIGAGTGLLGLMNAQQNNQLITLLEIDPQAAAQARENIAKSPWANRMQVINQSLQSFAPGCPEKFETIISNPPFFPNYLPSPKAEKNLAKHSQSLSYAELLKAVSLLLTDEGSFWVLLPFEQKLNFELLALKEKLYLEKAWHIAENNNKAFFRAILVFKKSISALNSPQILYIRNTDSSYSLPMTELMQPYYLKL